MEERQNTRKTTPVAERQQQDAAVSREEQKRRGQLPLHDEPIGGA